MSSKDISKSAKGVRKIATNPATVVVPAQLRAQGWGTAFAAGQSNSNDSLGQTPNLNSIGEVDNPNSKDNEEHVESEDEGNESEESSLAFEQIFEPAQLLWLESMGFSQSQLKLVEMTPGLGIDFANLIISFAVEKAEVDESLKRIRRDREALALLLQKEVGWSEKMIQEKAEGILKAQETLHLGTQGPWPQGQTSSSQGVPYTGNVGTMINVSGVKALRITSVSSETMQAFADHLKESVSGRTADNRIGILSTDAITSLHRALQGKLPECVPLTAKPEDWLALPAEKLAKLVSLAFPEQSVDTALDWNESFGELFVELDVRNECSYTTYLNSLTVIENNATHKSTPETEVVKTLHGALIKVPASKAGMKITRCNRAMHAAMKQYIANGEVTTIGAYVVHFTSIVNRAKTGLEQYSPWDNTIGESSTHKVSGKRGADTNNQAPSAKKTNRGPDPPADRLHCAGCNQPLPVYTKKVSNECRHCAGHPDRNTNGSWMGSNTQKALASKGFSALHRLKRVSGEQLNNQQLEAMKKEAERYPAPASFTNKSGAKSGNKGELNTASLNSVSINEGSLVTAQLTNNSNPTESIFIQVLPDTGASNANYVSLRVANMVRQFGSSNICKIDPALESSSLQLNLGGTKYNILSHGAISCNFTYLNELNNSFETINCLEFLVLDSTYDCIIGRPTIQKYKLARKISSFFNGQEEDSCTTVPVPSKHTITNCSCAHSNSNSHLRSICGKCKEEEMNGEESCTVERPTVKFDSKLSALCLAVIASRNDLLGESIADDDEIQWKDDPFDAIAPQSGEMSEARVQQISVHGSPELQKNIRMLCEEFKDIFSEYVRAEPARIPPMEIQIDDSKWLINKNRLPPRPQTEARQRAIQKYVSLYKELHVIEESNASAHSQVHLVPKPSDPTKEPEWRFCLDFVRLNEATIGTENWPIPNIPQMIQRIGTKKPKVFGVMDLTSGYHQAPLSISARLATAFICFVGLFHWLRVPMGLKNAAAYFQRMMATVVLSGIMYVLCELYIDDVFVFGKDENEFLDNLRQVFSRMRKYNITLNPKKVCLGQDHIEFVGHVVNADGISFSGEKRDKVLNFPLPVKVKQLMGFIGLVNYFREHVSDMTNKLKALRELTTDRKKPVQWTAETENLFFSVRDEVANCPTLFFLDANAEVFVLTDASDYGIGAYIYQIVDAKERPVIFMSKALSGAQLNWSTIEKEAYAIFFTLQTYEYLLKDIKFTLRTDHKNLTYLTVEGSQKVRRWRLFIQEFNFLVEHIAGVDNLVADAFSRLCTLDVADNDESVMLAVESAASPPTHGENTVSVATDKAKRRVEKIDKVNIPADCYKKISAVHNRTIGHSGVEQTISKLAASGQTWRNMRIHVQSFIRKCGYCQANSEKKITVKVKPFTRASYHPMEVLNIDTIGPLPQDDLGNEYILVIIDCFSRWVELYGIPDTSAMSAAQPLIQHCGRFGVPALIRSDRGSQFVNELISQLSEALLTTQELTTAYSKEQNAIVERANKEVMRHLKAMVYDDRVFNKWSTKQLPLVMRILNAEEKTRTGISPAEMLFGNAVDLGRYLLYRPKEPPNSDVDLNDYLEQMLERQSAYIKVAQETQREWDLYHMSRNDPDLSDFPVNSYVLWENPAGGRNKMQTKLQGPYQVVARQQDDIVMQDLITHKEVITHISNVREFRFDSDNTDPKEVAMHSSQEFVIDSILEHSFTGNKMRKGTLRFKVRWQGYTPEDDTWEPYKYLRDTEQLHAYLRANKMKSFIPAKFK